MKGLKLFVWKEVLCDYTCGMAFAIAKTKDEALKAIADEEGTYVIEELSSAEPEVYELNSKSVFGFAVYGGG